MSGIATVVIGSSIIGGVVSSNASDKASKRALEANQASLDAQERMYQQQRADFAPYQQLGLAALPEYYKMLGIQQPQNVFAAGQQALPSSQPGAPFSGGVGLVGGLLGRVAQTIGTAGPQVQPVGVQSQAGSGSGAAPALSPLARWQLMQTQRAQGRADTARGLSGSGGAASREAENAMAIAGQDYQNQYARILDALKIGTGASSAAGGASQQYSGQIGQAGANAGNILMDQGQTQANLWSGLGTLPMDYLNFQNKTQMPAMTTGQFTGGGGSLGAFNANSTVLGGPNGGAMMLPI